MSPVTGSCGSPAQGLRGTRRISRISSLSDSLIEVATKFRDRFTILESFHNIVKLKLL